LFERFRYRTPKNTALGWVKQEKRATGII